MIRKMDMRSILINLNTSKLINDDLYGCLVQFIFEKFDAG